MSASYNGYSWKERMRILDEFRRLERGGERRRLAYLRRGGHCEVCREPEVTGIGWHSEDYSRPFVFEPPATFIVCRVCHARIHKRFNQRDQWKVFLGHLRAGGYGREFTKRHSLGQRRAWEAAVAAGKRIEMRRIRRRKLSGREWWQRLTLEPDSLHAAWARPRPLRPRPGVRAYRAALGRVKPTKAERALLRAHAESPMRCATMSQLGATALPSGTYRGANAAYGRLAAKLAKELRWEPDRREDGSTIWMSTVAEGWQPLRREYEWVMVANLARALGKGEGWRRRRRD